MSTDPGLDMLEGELPNRAIGLGMELIGKNAAGRWWVFIPVVLVVGLAIAEWIRW